MSEKKWSRGRSINAAKQIPMIKVDCSGWESDIPPDQWSRGRSINGARNLGIIDVDASTWDTDSPGWVAVQLAGFADQSGPVVDLLRGLAPDLGLHHDLARSADLPTGRVVAVAPSVFPPDLRARLDALLSKVEAAKSNLPIVSVGVEWPAA